MTGRANLSSAWDGGSSTYMPPHYVIFDEKERQWNAFIGIITAIVGNILISFALNLQRYAHIRLERDHLQQEGLRLDRRPTRDAPNYGTQETSIDARLRGSDSAGGAEANGNGDTRALRHGSQETDRLLGSDNANGADESTPLQGGHRGPKKQIPSGPSDDDELPHKTYLSSPYWWAGILLMTTGEAGNFLAYGFAPASIVSPLGVVALISNCIIAPCLLREKFRHRDFWGVVVAVVGAVIVVLSSKTSEKKLGPNGLWRAITRWEFELYLGITIAAAGVLIWASERYGEKSILIDLGLVGIFGGYTALSTKGVASLLSDTLWRAITFPITYLVGFVLIGTALLQIRYVNRALQRFDSTQVIPTQFVLFTLSVIIGSAVLYRDFESVTKDQFTEFVGGCALTFVGVYLITSGRTREEDSGDDESSIEEGIDRIDEDFQPSRIPSVGGKAITIAADEPPSAGAPSSSLPNSYAAPRRRSRASSTLPRTPRHFNSGPSTISGASSPRSLAIDTSLIDNPWGSISDSPEDAVNLYRNEDGSPLPPPRERAMTDEGRTPAPRHTNPLETPLLNRRSMAHLVPRPFVSPLSSSLAGIVADPPSQRKRNSLPPPPLQRSAASDLLLEVEPTTGPPRTSEETGLTDAAGRSRSVGDAFDIIPDIEPSAATAEETTAERDVDP